MPAGFQMEPGQQVASLSPVPSTGPGAWMRKLWHNLTFAEVSGSLGDLGTFLPLTVAMSSTLGLDFGTTLIASGLANIASGLLFDCPICVQPMHTICGIALAAAQTTSPVTLPQVMAAGIFVSGSVLLLGITQLAELFGWLVPPAVIRGVQLGVGLNVAIKGVDMALRHKQGGAAVWRDPWGTDGLVLGAVALAFLLVTTMAPKLAAETEWQPLPRDTVLEPIIRAVTQRPSNTPPRAAGREERAPLLGGSGRAQVHAQASDASAHMPSAASLSGSTSGDCCVVLDRGFDQENGFDPAAAKGAALGAARADKPGCGEGCPSSSASALPSALLVVLLGIVLAAVRDPDSLSELRFGPSVPVIAAPSKEDFQTGIWRVGLPQLPLTTLNSVVAVAELARQLFPERDQQSPRRYKPSRFAMSVGVMNLVGCWFGALPTCHGAGGMAAQYKFGARNAAAPVILGLLKLVIGLCLGSSMLVLLSSFPAPLLGSLLALAGVELACSARAQAGARGYTLMLLTATSILAIDTGLGFVIGWSAAVLVALSGMLETPVHNLWQRLRAKVFQRRLL